MVRILVCLGILALLSTPTSHAQQKNLNVFQHLAIQCLGSVPKEVKSFRLTAPSAQPYIRSALVSYWRSLDHRIFLPDSSAANSPTSLALLSYSIDEATVTYSRLRKKKVARQILLTTHYSYTSQSGELLDDSSCTQNYKDTLAFADLASIENDIFPETTATHPQKNWLSRYIEPVLLATASALGVYLFFTIRSDNNSDGS